MLLNVDLNVPLPTENREQEGTSAHTGSVVGPSVQGGGSIPCPPIDLEAVDDDVVIISSPRAFAEATNNSRTRGNAVLVDLDSGLSSRVAPNSRSKRRRVSANQTQKSGNLYINLEGSSNTVGMNVLTVTIPPPPPPPPPKEPTFTCPVCMGPLVEEMSTKCGHIFCKKCIRAAIATQSKCPTCRRKISMKNTIRVYLPTSN